MMMNMLIKNFKKCMVSLIPAVTLMAVLSGCTDAGGSDSGVTESSAYGKTGMALPVHRCILFC